MCTESNYTGKYDSLLEDVPFYKIHKSYLPFVGDKYDTYRILIVGESHYINQKPGGTAEYDLKYFREHWWNGTSHKLDADPLQEGWYCTRKVLNNYMNGHRTRGHLIFTNLVKAFSETILNQPVEHISNESAKQFRYFSFMNFFQMPSLYQGMKFWDSLKKFGETDKNCPEWDHCVKVSSAVLDEVIDILQPEAVIFASKSAHSAFSQSSARYANDAKIDVVSHPGCPWWYGKDGKGKFEKILIGLKDKNS